ncbi:MAG: hypothetical protein COU47_02100 [Candidatus Niyogibacteria bacterium CG10_big_fil_rev_8_21_14_0_10_46_36]|uniref:VWFA domain-containing protein n=1 Tax=Candidatus Niyogibacteria bacterium CG10_big_fil_rev_8_21_14_0_10_46_36 TaxID=1974726 RepID=A0A2H0TD95_9BACT|nr:MAG: hypothetical protein COU47_02100 [Candidatus Niyogibacteria bacterium CG10_big_fil_rev_8_21_14_0_10_46_36]
MTMNNMRSRVLIFFSIAVIAGTVFAFWHYGFAQGATYFNFSYDVDPLVVSEGQTFNATLTSPVSLTGAGIPLDIVLLLDTSNSMNYPSLVVERTHRLQEDASSGGGDTTDRFCLQLYRINLDEIPPGGTTPPPSSPPPAAQHENEHQKMSFFGALNAYAATWYEFLPGGIQAQWSASSPGSGWENSGLTDCNGGAHTLQDASSCSPSSSSQKLYLRASAAPDLTISWVGSSDPVATEEDSVRDCNGTTSHDVNEKDESTCSNTISSGRGGFGGGGDQDQFLRITGGIASPWQYSVRKGWHENQCLSGWTDTGLTDQNGYPSYIPSRLTRAKEALTTFVSLLDTSIDRASLVTFNGVDGAIVHSGLTADTNLLSNRIQSLSARGNTPMGSGLQAANGVMASARNNVGKYIILAGDGQENMAPSVLNIMASTPSDVTVFTIGIGEGIQDIVQSDCAALQQQVPGAPCQSGEATLQAVAANAGSGDGQYFFAPDASQLTTLYTDILKLIRDRELQSVRAKVTIRPEFEFISAVPAPDFVDRSGDDTLVTWPLGELRSGDSVTINMTLRALTALPETSQPQDINKNTNLSTISYIDSGTLQPNAEDLPVMQIRVVRDLAVVCSPSVANAFIGDSVLWSSSVAGGFAPYTYTWHGEKVEGASGSSVTVTYDTVGTKTASLTVRDSNGATVDQQCDSGVNISSFPIINADLTAVPSRGPGPLLSVNLNAQLTTGYDSSKGVNYSFWWDCDSATTDIASAAGACGSLPSSAPGTCVSNTNGAKCDAIMSSMQSVGHLYPNSSKTNPATFMPKVIIEHGSALPAEDRTTIIVDPIPVSANLSCSPTLAFIHNPTDSAVFTGAGGDEGNYSWDISGSSPDRCTGIESDDGLTFSVRCFNNGTRDIILEDGTNPPRTCKLQVNVPEYEEF